MLSGYTRLTYSLVVIMLETTSSINIFIPMMIGIMTSRSVGQLFSVSLYDRALRMKQMPFLRGTACAESKYIRAGQIMATEVITLPTIANMEACKKALQSHHNGYPVVNTAGRLVGLIPKCMVVKLLEKKQFYDKERTDSSSFHQDEHPVPVAFSLNDKSGDEPLLDNLSPSEISRQGTAAEFDLEYDAKNGFPATPDHKILPWVDFQSDIHSTEADAEHVILDVIEECYEEWIDLRPYMIESPIAVSIHDKFFKVLEQFRINHCRHMMVIDPANGDLKGVITRKDIFAYNGL